MFWNEIRVAVGCDCCECDWKKYYMIDIHKNQFSTFVNNEIQQLFRWPSSYRTPNIDTLLCSRNSKSCQTNEQDKGLTFLMKLFALAKYSKLIEKTCFRRVFTWAQIPTHFSIHSNQNQANQASIETRANIQYSQFTPLSISRGQNDKFRMPFSHLTFAIRKKWKLITSFLFISTFVLLKRQFFYFVKEHCT